MEIELKPSHTQYEAYQYLIASEIVRFILMGGGAGGGKSWIICEWLLYMSYRYPGTKWFIGRNELKRLMATTYVTWLKVLSFHNIPENDWKLNQKWSYIECFNGSRIDLLDVKYQPADPLYERLGSTEYTGGALEEAGEMHELVFEVLKTRIGRHLNTKYGIVSKILLSCNPKQNWLKSLFYDPYVLDTLPENMAFVQSLAADNPHNSEEYLQTLEDITDDVMRERLAKGNWNYEFDPYCIFDLDGIYNLTKNTYLRTGRLYKVPCISVDPSAEGKDSTIITVWDGWVAKRIIKLRFSKADKNKELPKTMVFIDELCLELQIPKKYVVVEMDGLGVGLVQFGGYTGCRVSWAAVGSGKKIYLNVRAQCYYLLSERVNDGTMLVEEDAFSEKGMKTQMEQELKAIKKAHPDSDEKKIAIIKREEIVKTLGHSPDIVSSWLPRAYISLRPPLKKGEIEGYV